MQLNSFDLNEVIKRHDNGISICKPDFVAQIQANIALSLLAIFQGPMRIVGLVYLLYSVEILLQFYVIYTHHSLWFITVGADGQFIFFSTFLD